MQFEKAPRASPISPRSLSLSFSFSRSLFLSLTHTHTVSLSHTHTQSLSLSPPPSHTHTHLLALGYAADTKDGNASAPLVVPASAFRCSRKASWISSCGNRDERTNTCGPNVSAGKLSRGAMARTSEPRNCESIGGQGKYGPSPLQG